MKVCAIVEAGIIREVFVVSDDHEFGVHGLHVHVEVNVVAESECPKGAPKKETTHGV